MTHLTVYEVFARKSRGEPLRHIGNVNAASDELARIYAYNTYDEEKWFDMWITPRSGLLEVFQRDETEGVLVGGRSLAEAARGAAADDGTPLGGTS